MIVIESLLFGLLLAVMISDAEKFKIPNLLVLLILLLYPAWAGLTLTPTDWIWSAAIAGGCLLVGFGLFLLRWMGGGDVKLLVVCALWAGKLLIIPFLVYMSLSGGLLSLTLLFGRPLVAMGLPGRKLPRLLRVGEPVPYGIAIALGLMLAFGFPPA